MFGGLSAFPLTPPRDGGIDYESYERVVASAALAGVDSIGALGSTGSYAYFNRQDRAAVARAAVTAAGDVPVIVGVGAFSTAAVLENVEDAANAGAAGVLLAAVSYQPLSDAEVHGLFEDVTSRFPEVPVVLYDNPDTTGFTFSDELRARVAHLPGVVSIKLDSIPEGHDAAAAYVENLRGMIPDGVSIGISGDAAAASGLLAGCDVWYSVLGGTFPSICRQLSNAARNGDDVAAQDVSTLLAPIWALFARHGSFRTTGAIATLSGLLPADAVYAPVRPLTGGARREVESALRTIGPLT